MSGLPEEQSSLLVLLGLLVCALAVLVLLFPGLRSGAYRAMQAILAGGSAGEEEEDSPDFEKEVLDSLQLTTKEVAACLAVHQRLPDGRAHPDWLTARRNRCTASRFAAACSAKGARSTPNDVVEAMMTMPEGDAKNAGRFGIVWENVARQAYIQERHKAAREAEPKFEFELREVGLCVWEQEPWLAGSPDGICCENGVPCGLLEVKTAKFWTKENEERLWSRMPCDWVYQVQGGMRLASAALGTQLCWCDVFLWTPERSECRRVAFDPELWEGSMLPQLRRFYFERFLPKAAERVRARRHRSQVAARKRVQRKKKR